MSESNSVTTPTDSNQEVNEAVPRKAYEDVSRDMHKYKQKAKETEMALNEYQAKLKAIEEQKMAEENRWKELYEKKNSELELEKKQLSDKQRQLNDTLKRNALRSELGGKIKSEYLVHADISAIEMSEDGTVVLESVQKVANAFRKDHGQLIPSSNNSNITGQAAPTEIDMTKNVDVKTLSQAQRIKLLNDLTRKQ